MQSGRRTQRLLCHTAQPHGCQLSPWFASLAAAAKPSAPLPAALPIFPSQVAWRNERSGEWRYPEKLPANPVDTLTWEELQPMMRDRFVDHPRLPRELRESVLPLQTVGGRTGGAAGGGHVSCTRRAAFRTDA
jgi:hypothetical protein